MKEPQLPPHKFNQLVNELRQVSVTYGGTQQLRAHIVKALSTYVNPDHPNLAEQVDITHEFSLEDLEQILKTYGKNSDTHKLALSVKSQFLLDDSYERRIRKLERAKNSSMKLLKEASLKLLEAPWIKCEDRMPEIGQRVVYHFDLLGTFMGTYTDHNTFTGDNGGWLVGDVTHWFPVPENPQ